MRWLPRVIAATMFCLLASPAGAARLRVPQVVFDAVPLQGLLGQFDPGCNASTDQLDVQSCWNTQSPVPPYMNFALAEHVNLEVGLYDRREPSPRLDLIFPADAQNGSFTSVHFGSTGITIVRFDPLGVYLGQATYPPMNADSVAFYVHGACGTWFSEDARNVPPGPQALGFLDTFFDGYYFWAAFEACPYGPQASTFAGALFQFGFMADPASGTTWGRLKSRYR